MAQALVSMAQQFSGLPIKSLIGGPLSAAAEANANMAYTQYQFMMNICFNETAPATKGGKPGLEPVMVGFTITRSVLNADGTAVTPSEAKIHFELPLLTIIPLNSLAVQSVDVTFEMEVKSSTSTDHSTSSSSQTSEKGGFSASVGYGPFKAEVHGSVSHNEQHKSSSSEHYQASNSAKYTIDVKAGQLPLPQGVQTIISAFTKNISPIMLGADAADDKGAK